EQGPGLREETGFVNLKGKLPWPVEGRVTSRFGRRRDAATQTWTRSRGIDIRVPKGTEVTAVGAGKIVMVDWFRGYGSFVIVSHGQNYYTLYAHLDEIHVQKNEHVQQGQVIGLSGDSGTLGEEKLHFELLGGPQALNPLDWLQPRRTGL
ncbi:MAG TPA: peptidoglycan DD-metalloendopeptidase family protein, partial [Candidatus Latescibacteria bacterium]|nr:peptidoglycan DD-metalloendopeptidase family protein [Candidatus Latescibacterota bacterium]